MQIEMKIRGLMMDPVTNVPIVILKGAEGNALLPIWVGVYEANAIALEIEKNLQPAPHDPRSAEKRPERIELFGDEGGGEPSSRTIPFTPSSGWSGRAA